MKRIWGLSFFAALALGGFTLAGCSSSDSTPMTPPSAPTGLSATPANSAVSLTWPAVSGATSYDVYRATSTGALAAKTKVGTTTTGPAYTDAAANGTAYYYQVTASNIAGTSAGSNEVTATPLATLPPGIPTGVTATASNRSVMISWSTVPTATSYNIYWSTTPGVTTGTGTRITFASRPFVHSLLTNGTAYYYVVTAVNGFGESTASLEVTATPNVPQPYINASVVKWPSSGLPFSAPVYSVDVCTDPGCFVPVSNATVTVSGTLLTYASGSYTASSPTPAPGAPLDLSVTIPPGSAVADGTYTASGAMYVTAPRITSPTNGATWMSSVANTITWTAGAPTATSPESEYGLLVLSSTFTSPLPGGSVELPVSTLSYTLPANSATAGSYTAFVGILPSSASGGIPIPNTQAGSGLVIAAFSGVVNFTVQ